jgi:hypothetical protein
VGNAGIACQSAHIAGADYIVRELRTLADGIESGLYREVESNVSHLLFSRGEGHTACPGERGCRGIKYEVTVQPCALHSEPPPEKPMTGKYDEIAPNVLACGFDDKEPAPREGPYVFDWEEARMIAAWALCEALGVHEPPEHELTAQVDDCRITFTVSVPCTAEQLVAIEDKARDRSPLTVGWVVRTRP